MEENTKSLLDAAFNKHRTQQQAEADAKAKQETKEEATLSKFLKLRSDVIVPTMKEIGEYAKSNGHGYYIRLEEDQLVNEGRTKRSSASASIEFQISERDSRYNTPHLAVILEKGEDKVQFHESVTTRTNGGHSGSAGDVKLDDVTPELIQQKVAKVLAACLN